jgi:hypothetical protein
MVLVRHLWTVTGTAHVAFLARGIPASSSHSATSGSPNSAHNAASSSANPCERRSARIPRLIDTTDWPHEDVPNAFQV